MDIQFARSKPFKFRDQLVWAEGGLICIENQNDGDFKVITRAEAAARAISINEELKRCTYPSDRDELMNCVVNLCETIKEGKRQGDPTHPEVRKQRIKDLRKVSILMAPGSSSIEVLSREGLGSGTLIGGTLLSNDKFRKLRI